MAWDDLEAKIRSLEERLSDTEKMMEGFSLEPPVNVLSPYRDYWRMRLIDERILWEKKLERERTDKEFLRGQVEQQRIKIKELEWRLEQLVSEFNQQRQLFEEKLKTKDAEYKLALKIKEEELRLQQPAVSFGSPGMTPPRGMVSESEFFGVRNELERKIEQLEEERNKERKKWEEEKSQLEKRLTEQEKINQGKFIEETERVENRIRKEYNETLIIHEQAHLFTTEELARGFAHRLRNSIGIVSGLTQLATSDPAVKGPLRETLESVVKAIDEMIEQVNDFVKLTYVPEMVLQPFEINVVLLRLLSEIENKSKEQKIGIAKKLNPELPLVMLDSHLLEEGFLNILGNAIESMPGGGTLTLETSYDPEKKEVIVNFIDTGIGIPEHQVGKIFQSFFTTKKGKKGLGLSRARRIIDLHHGLIEVSSVKDKGTTVSIRLPAVVE